MDFIKKLFAFIFSKEESESSRRTRIKWYIKNLFSTNALWKDYPTVSGGVTGLAPDDVYTYVCKSESLNMKDVTLVEVFSIMLELKEEGMLFEYSKTHDDRPVFRAHRMYY